MTKENSSNWLCLPWESVFFELRHLKDFWSQNAMPASRIGLCFGLGFIDLEKRMTANGKKTIENAKGHTLYIPFSTEVRRPQIWKFVGFAFEYLTLRLVMLGILLADFR